MTKLAKNADKTAAYLCRNHMCGKMAENAVHYKFVKYAICDHFKHTTLLNILQRICYWLNARQARYVMHVLGFLALTLLCEVVGRCYALKF